MASHYSKQMYESTKNAHDKRNDDDREGEDVIRLEAQIKKSILVVLIVLCVVPLTYGKSKHYVEVEKLDYGKDTLHCYKYYGSGLNVLWIENDDVNKSFMLGVKTPTTDSTGVNHIIEHTLFTGSKKYPSSTVFFDASAQYPTLFMNALTSADLTMFPFCTPYKACYDQLFDIYLDSIFNPNMLNQPYSFYEEAFYYNTETKSYGGVVYNEMKGANIELGRNVFRALRRGFFEGTHYANDSGGSVEEIPTLAYEAFVKTYEKFYYPNNMLLVLYGDLEIENYLEKLHEYVKVYTLSDQWIDVNVPFRASNEPLELTYEGEGEDLVLVKGFLLKNGTTKEEEMVLDLWIQTYWNDEQSILRKKLEKAGVPPIEVIKDDGTQYPIYGIVVKDVKPYEKEKINVLLEKICQDIQGYKDIAKEEETLKQTKFSLQELGQKGLRGVSLSDYMIDAWAHDKEYSDYYQQLEGLKNIAEFNIDIKEIFKNNIAERTLYLKATKAAGEEPSVRSPISPKDWGKINEGMWQWQKENSHKQLPQIAADKMRIDVHFPKVKKTDKMTYLVTPTTSDLHEIRLYLPVDHVQQEALPYLFIYSHFLNQIAKEQVDFVGKAQVGIASIDHEEGENHNYLEIQLTTLRYQDAVLFYEYLLEEVNKQEQLWYLQTIKEHTSGFEERVKSNILGNLKIMNGGGQTGSKRYQYEKHYPLYEFLNTKTNEEKLAVAQNALKVGETIGFNEDAIVGITGLNKEMRKTQEAWNACSERHKNQNSSYNKYHFEKKHSLNKFYQQTAVDYVVCTYDKCEDWVDGQDYVMASYATQYYLQPLIRVEKGAYGSGLHAVYPNTISMYTYRDPDYKSSLSVFQNLAMQLKEEIDDEKIERARIEALSNFQNQLKLLGNVYECTGILEKLILAGVTDKDLNHLQKEILDTNKADLKEKFMLYQYILPKSQVGICTDKNSIQDSKLINKHKKP